MHEVVEGIFMWSRLSVPHGYDFNGFLVTAPEGNLVIDPVEPEDASLAEIARLGAARILLTNRNHSRAANRVRAATGARTAIAPGDAAHARAQGTEIDDDLSVGARIGPLEVVDAAGKSPGEVAFFWRERRLLIVGDSIIGWPAGACRLLPEEKLDDPERLRTSVRALARLDFETLLVGDGVPIRSGARAAVEALIAAW